MIKYATLSLIKTYQILVSPLLGKHCRFYPSCSCYTSVAIQKYGWADGLKKSVKRILKCRPGNPGGVDLP